jgi:uncharacterized protein (TIGR00661 family)
MKILYGVPGEGMGHATRSKVIIAHLLKKHELRIVSSSRAAFYLRKAFPGKVTVIKGFHLAYKNAEVDKIRTAYSILKTGPANLLENFKRYVQLDKSFQPDIVISDFESFSFLYALHHHLPIISIDNMQIINRCRLEIPVPPVEKQNYLLAKSIIKAKVPGCARYIISTFFYPPVLKKSTVLVPPVLRPEILAAQPKKGGHLLVYQSSQSQNDLLRILHALPGESFCVYGYNREQKTGNVVFRTFSEKGFVEDLATCKGVITNGGFSLISEAIWLKKPVCAIPLQNQFEQFLNAAYLEKYGYGRMFSVLTPDFVRSFLYQIEDFRKKLAGYTQEGNGLLFSELDQVLEQSGTNNPSCSVPDGRIS